MKVIIKENYQSMCDWAAEHIASAINNHKENRPFVLGLPTGSSPLGVYKKLIEMNKEGKVTFKNVVTFNMDEYVGLPREHDQSYWYFMHDNFFNHIDIPAENVNILNGMAEDLEAECIRYEKNIEDLGGIDLQILGIGNNGHIGFNEPDESFIRYTHVVDLKESTILANSRFFDSIDEVPKQALTMGIKSIMNAKKILLIINTPTKKDITEKALFGEITPQVPASILQLHPRLTVVMCDEQDPVLLK